MNDLHWFVYWNMVFGAACWFAHETWPYGLWMIPLTTAYVWLLRKEAQARARGKR